MKKGFQLAPQEKLVERAYLVGVSLPDSSIAKEGEYLDELMQLAATAGAVVVGKSIQGRTRIDGATFIGPGKAQEIKQECEELGVNLVIFDSDLSPAQARNLEKILNINVILHFAQLDCFPTLIFKNFFFKSSQAISVINPEHT